MICVVEAKDEKNSSKYEESASVLYEKLIDDGYNNAYYREFNC